MAGELEEVTRRLVETKVLEALKSNDEYLETLVEAAFRQEVDGNGRTDGYSSRKMPWLKYVALDAIRQASWGVVRKWVSEEVAPKLEESIKGAMTKEDFLASVIKAGIERIDVHDMVVDVRFKQPGE